MAGFDKEQRVELKELFTEQQQWVTTQFDEQRKWLKVQFLDERAYYRQLSATNSRISVRSSKG